MRSIQLVVVATLAAMSPAGAGTDTFHKMTAAEIKAKVIGMEISEPHFSEQYMNDGTVRIVSLGRRITGKWKISGDQICIEAPKPEDSKCMEIWRFGEKYQLRFLGDPVPFDVTIEKQQDRGW